MLAICLGNLDDRNIEGTTTEVIHSDSGVTGFLVHAVGECSGRWLVDYALNVETGNLARVFGRLTLRIVEVGRHGNNRFRHRLAQKVFRRLLHLHQHLCCDLRRRHLLAIYLNPGIAIIGFDNLVRHHLDVFLHDVVFKLTTYQTLDSEQCVVRVRYRLTLRRLTNKRLTVTRIRDDGRRGAITLGVFNYLGFATIQHCYAGVGGAQVDTNYLSHCSDLRSL